MNSTSDQTGRRRAERLSLRALFLLVTGEALAWWLWAPLLREDYTDFFFLRRFDHYFWVMCFIVLLGGASLVGAPLLLWHQRQDKRRWGPGRILWFVASIATWLLWLQLVMERLRGTHRLFYSLYVWGTPIAEPWLFLALLAGRWIGRKRRPARRLPWTEPFGLLLGLLWACVGCYITIYVFYGEDMGLWKVDP